MAKSVSIKVGINMDDISIYTENKSIKYTVCDKYYDITNI